MSEVAARRGDDGGTIRSKPLCIDGCLDLDSEGLCAEDGRAAPRQWGGRCWLIWVAVSVGVGQCVMSASW